MSFSVSIHAPKTPVTAGSGGEAKATIPNVCKLPGPPAPFVPSPLPNIAKSGNSPKDYSTSVLIEGEKIAIRGATFESMGDIASKGTGGGLISANTQGIAKFIPPGTMDVKIEGKGVHLKGDQMLNNCASGGTPPNTGATMMGLQNPKGEKGHECPPHFASIEAVDRDQEIANQEQRVKDSEGALNQTNQAHTNAVNALASPPAGARMSTLRQQVKITAKAIPGAESHLAKQKERLESLKWEKKVGDDMGGSKTYKILCAKCKVEMGDFDVVTSDRVKEVKSSAGGFDRGQFDKLKELVEGQKLLGEGLIMKVAVPAAVRPQVEHDNPDLKDRIQGH